MNEIITKEAVVTLQDDIKNARADVFNVSKPSELTKSVIILTQAKEAIKQAKTKLKDFEKEPKQNIKEMEIAFLELENDIKEKFKETYKSETVVKLVGANEETGEAIFKEYKNDNKGSNMFTHTPAKKSTVLDMEKITRETYPHLFKEVTSYVIDMDAVNAEFENLPQKTIETPEKVGIQWTQIKKVIAEKLEEK